MKTCSSCGTYNKDSSKFCANCGKELSGKIICPHCKKTLKPADSFCKYCGKSLKEEEQKTQRKKPGRLKISLISIGAFLGFVIISFAGLLLFTKYYLVDQYTFSYDHTGEVHLVKSEGVPEFDATGLTVCDSIDEINFTPLNSRDEFEMGFREIYATVSLDGVTGDDLLSFKWICEDTGEEINGYTYDLDFEEGYFAGNIYFPLVIPPEENIMDYQMFSQPGNYRVEFYHNHKLVDSAPFEVIAPELSFKEQLVFDTFDAEAAIPLKAGEKFGLQSDQLLSGINVSGRIEKDDNFQFVLRDETGKILKDTSSNYNDLTDRDYFEDNYIYFYIYGPYADRELSLGPGNYVVEFYHNSKLTSSTPFEVTPPSLAFGDLILAKNTDSSKAPIEPTLEFILGTKKICATIYVQAAEDGDTWSFIWKDQEEVIREFEDVYYVNEGEYFNGYKNIDLYIPEGQSIDGADILGYPGEYLVEYYHNGEMIDSQRFEVVDSGISFGELIICKDVNDEDNSPINPANTFSFGTEQIFAAIDVTDAGLEDQCRFVWVNKDSDEIIRDYTLKYAENRTGGGTTYDGYIARGIKLGEGEALESHDLLGNPGNYIVYFYHKGYLMSSASFKITQ